MKIEKSPGGKVFIGFLYPYLISFNAEKMKGSLLPYMFMKLVCYVDGNLPVASNMYPTFQPLTFKNRGSKIRNANVATYIIHAKLFWC